jgi:DNA-binding LacI/PurR family transcriptional regulator
MSKRPVDARGGNVAPYVAIMQDIQRDIETGSLRPGQKLASQNELAAQFGVCQATIQRSLKELQREGLISAQQGKGRYIAQIAKPAKTWNIAVILFDLAHIVHPVASQRLAGITEVLGPAGYDMVTLALNARRGAVAAGEPGISPLSLLHERGFDGVIVVAQETAGEAVREVARQMPTVWIDAPFVERNLAGVHVDVLGGGFAAARHLVDLGHRLIAFLAPNRARYRISGEQYDGVRLGVRGPGDAAQNDPVPLDVEGFSEEEAEHAMRRMLELAPRPTAVICSCDEMARGALRGIASAGLRVPDDISVVAWNDTIPPEEFGVALTTVQQDFRATGVLAARNLLSMIECPGTQGRIVQLESQLVVRASTARRSPAR